MAYHGSDSRWLVEYMLCRGERKLFHGCRLGTKYRWSARTLPGLSPNGRTYLGWYRDMAYKYLNPNDRLISLLRSTRANYILGKDIKRVTYILRSRPARAFLATDAA